jgi:DNA polymerase-1
MGAVTLSETLNITEDEAHKLQSEFKSTFPGVNKYFNECLSQCKAMGLVKTLSGRIRHLPDINSDIPKVKCKFLLV